MLDTAILEQLKVVFAPLANDIVLRYDESTHADQGQLGDMLESVASASPRLSAQSSGRNSPTPQFRFVHAGRDTGISFRGIPGGHEFTTLILAILNSDGQGKLPDAAIADRVRRLKGPLRLSTYLSLSCETCPDVVQALNQMALLHPDFHHAMIDGGYAQDEIDALGIQGVPSLIVDGKLLHSGRINFLDLLTKLEAHFGASDAATASSAPRELGHFDVVVVGGGPAGASAAIYSVRKGLKTALIAEKLGGQVQETKGIENLISVPYVEGPQLAGQLSQHLGHYPVRMLEHRRVKRIEKGATKTLHLESGESLTAETVIVATGAKWRELGVPGEKEYIGRGVAFCPHCDGPYYKGKKVAVVGGGNSGVEAAIDLAGIVSEVVLLEFADQLKADHVLVEKMKSLPNVSFVTSAKTERVLGDGAKVVALEYQDRKTEKTQRIDLDGVFVQIGLLPNSQFLKDTVELTKFGEIVVDPKGRTSEPGIYAAGDVTTLPFKQIIIAMGEGAKTALAAFEDRMRKG